LLAGQQNRVEKVIAVRNQAQSPVRFVMEPYEQLRALDWIESNGLDLIGIFHSHPTGPETVSPTDMAQATYAVVYIILARADGAWNARGFWIEDGAFSEITLQII
jgi:proteasome lid subunit RPN8/RPN11